MYKAIVCSYKEPEETLEKCLKYIRKANGIPVLVKGISPVGKARNTGLMLVNNDYVFFVDADELVPPKYFSNMINFLEKNDPKLGGIWALHVPPKNATLLQKLDQKLLNYFQRKNMGKDVVSIGCGGSCYTRQAIQGVKFNEKVVTAEDVAFCRKVRERGWKLRIAPIEVEHTKPKDYHDFINSEFYGGVGYVQRGGSFLYSIKRLCGSPFRGLQLSIHFHEPLFFFYYPLRILFWFGGVLKAFCSKASYATHIKE